MGGTVEPPVVDIDLVRTFLEIMSTNRSCLWLFKRRFIMITLTSGLWELCAEVDRPN